MIQITIKYKRTLTGKCKPLHMGSQWITHRNFATYLELDLNLLGLELSFKFLKQVGI